jgi:hypothetical protein
MCIKRICEQCKVREIFVTPTMLARGRGKFCSCECKNASQRGKVRPDLSAKIKEKWTEPEYVAKQNEKAIKQSEDWKGEHNPGRNPTDQTRAKMRANHADVSGEKNPSYGKPMPDHVKEAFRIANLDRKGEKHPRYGKPIAHSVGRWYVLPDGNQMWVRSSYEEVLLEVMFKMEIKWEYEPVAFPLKGLGKTYRPDFYLLEYDLYIDTKGYWWEDAPEKTMAFMEQYPEKTLKLIYKPDIIKLKQALKNGDEIDITQYGTTKIYSPLN